VGHAAGEGSHFTVEHALGAPVVKRVFYVPIDRRRFFKSMALASAGFTLPGYLAEALTLTPRQTQGPFYPLADDIPLHKDNDLLYLDDRLTAASGIVTYISGRVLTSSGEPIRGALVELWATDANGVYTYSSGVGRNPAADPNFAGFGQFITGSSGGYRFRTIQPGLYAGRTRHFHFGITVPGQLSRFPTQTYWSGEPRNATDGPLNAIANPEQRNSVILTYTPVPGTTTGEVQTTWDIVMGFTPMEPIYPSGSLVIAGASVAGPVGGNPRYRLTLPAYTNYTYEVYANPTFGGLGWGALGFSLTQTGAIDRNKYTAPSDGTLNLYLEAKPVRNFYLVTFRVPGANTGTP
jgi:protocatechuate 3,4-dioxygenase beta subunit